MKKFTFLAICIIWSMSVSSQTLSPDVIATAGDYFVGTNATLSWTLGEAVIETFTDGQNVLTQGFQQPIYQIVAVEDMEDETYDVKIYPIPARDNLNIDIISSVEPANLKVEMYDVMGNIIYDKTVMSTTFHENLVLSNYMTNMFFLKITNTESQTVKTFKILKVKF